MMFGTFFMFLLAQDICQAEVAQSIDTSLPSTSIGLYLKSLVRRELGFEHLQDLSYVINPTDGVFSYEFTEL